MASKTVALKVDVSAPAQVEPPVSQSTAMVSMIERAVLNGVDIQTVERLMAMKERLESQDAMRAFNAAVAAAKGEIPQIIKNKTVDFTGKTGHRTNYKHETFDEIARLIDPVLAKHGLSYRFRSQQSPGTLTVTCILSHAAGHFEETTLSSGEDHTGNKNAIQAIGSASLYLQRYTLKLALGLASASVDDDGRKTSAPDTISEAQEKTLRDRITGSPVHDINEFLAHFKIENLSDLPAKQFGGAMFAMTEREKNAAKEAKSNG